MKNLELQWMEMFKNTKIVEKIVNIINVQILFIKRRNMILNKNNFFQDQFHNHENIFHFVKKLNLFKKNLRIIKYYYHLKI